VGVTPQVFVEENPGMIPMRNSSTTVARRHRLTERVLVSAIACFLGGLWTPATFAVKAPCATLAQALKEQPLPLADVKSYSYYSKLMQRQYDVNVAIPSGYGSHPERKYPALLLTDGNYSFEMAHSICQDMGGGEIEPPILISIGSPVAEGIDGFTRRRVQEFSTPNWAMQDPFGKAVADTCKKSAALPGQPCVGGAPKFLSFITSELLPELSKVYRIDIEDLGLFGHSAGGFFTSWVMFQGDARFKRFIIGSPAMAYGDGEIFRLEKQYSETHKDLRAGAYVGSGTLELADPFLEHIGMIVSGQARLSSALNARNYPSLKLYAEIHQNLGHSDVVLVVLARGLRLLYPKEPQSPR
jgi:predicted alpha/beta superfamily hydrolase